MCHLHLPGGIALSFLFAPTVLSTDFYQPTDNLLLYYKSQQIHTVVPPLWFLHGLELDLFTSEFPGPGP